MSETCLLLYDFARVGQADLAFVSQLQQRGFAVVVAACGADRKLSPLAARFRMWLENVFISRRRLSHIESLPAQGIHPVSSGAELEALIESQRPTVIVDFRAHDPSGFVSSCNVYRIELDRRFETLRMDSAYIGRSKNRELEVMRTTRGECRVVQRSTIISSNWSASADQSACSTRALVLLLRAIDDPASGGNPVEGRPDVASRNLETIAATIVAVVGALVRRASAGWWRTGVWFLAYRTGATSRSSSKEWKYFLGGPDRFYADPCAVSSGAASFVFYEDYRYALGRGVISVSELQADGTLGAPKTVLERPYHLSYPFVFEAAGGWWMVPETAENRTVELYRATTFPFEWMLHTTLLSEINAVDATLHFQDGQWWMFVNVGEHGSSTWDELSIFMADELTGPWRPHPRNPVKRQARSARPAGRLFQDGQMLVRPTQDCSTLYGGGVRFCRIDVLTATDFAEEEIAFLPPSEIPGAEALHTWTEAGGLQVIDAKLRSAPVAPRRFARRLEKLRKRNQRAAIASADPRRTMRYDRHGDAQRG